RTGDPLARAVRGSSHGSEGASELQRHVRSAQLRGAQPGFNAKTVLPQMEGLEIGAAHGHTRGTQALASPALRLARVSEKIVHFRDAGGDQGLRARSSAPGVVTGQIGRASCRESG